MNPTLAAGVVMMAYKNRLVAISAEERTIDHFRPKCGISIRAVPSSTPGTPATAMIILNLSLERKEIRVSVLGKSN